MAAACRDCRLTAAEARINRRALRALRRANRRKVFDKEVNKARVAAKMHVERMRLYVAGVAGVAAALAPSASRCSRCGVRCSRGPPVP